MYIEKKHRNIYQNNAFTLITRHSGQQQDEAVNQKKEKKEKSRNRRNEFSPAKSLAAF